MCIRDSYETELTLPKFIDTSMDIDGDGVPDAVPYIIPEYMGNLDGTSTGVLPSLDLNGDGVADECDECPFSETDDTLYPNDICDNHDVLGCMDNSACNYNELATFQLNDESCLFVDGVCETCSGDTDGTGTIVDNDSDDIDSSYPFATGYSRATMQDIKQTLPQYYKPLYLVK